MKQLEMITPSLEEKVDLKVSEMKEQVQKVRKSLFARHSELQKHYLDLKNEFELLKSILCRKEQMPREIENSHTDFNDGDLFVWKVHGKSA